MYRYFCKVGRSAKEAAAAADGKYYKLSDFGMVRTRQSPPFDFFHAPEVSML
jgi:hypothetical protein